MTVVDRVLVMNFNKLPRAIINLLIKSHRCLVGVNLFHVPGLPSLPALHIEPISPSTRGEAFPMGKFPFILFTRTHRMSIDPEASILSSVLIPGLRDISQWLDPKTPFPGSGDWTGQGKRLPDRHRLNTQHSGPRTQHFPGALSTQDPALPGSTAFHHQRQVMLCPRLGLFRIVHPIPDGTFSAAVQYRLLLRPAGAASGGNSRRP